LIFLKGNPGGKSDIHTNLYRLLGTSVRNRSSEQRWRYKEVQRSAGTGFFRRAHLSRASRHWCQFRV